MSAGFRNTRRIPSSRASRSNAEPWSVIAVKRRPGSGTPASSRRARKYRYWESVSIVRPDLLETRKNVRSSRCVVSAVRMDPGSVESRTSRVGAPGDGAITSARTSGARLEPPIPRSSTRVNPSDRISVANAVSSPILSWSHRGESSHPRRLAMVFWCSGSRFQSEASRRKRRAIASCRTSDSRAAR